MHRFFFVSFRAAYSFRVSLKHFERWLHPYHGPPQRQRILIHFFIPFSFFTPFSLSMKHLFSLKPPGAATRRGWLALFWLLCSGAAAVAQPTTYCTSNLGAYCGVGNANINSVAIASTTLNNPTPPVIRRTAAATRFTPRRAAPRALCCAGSPIRLA